MAEGENAVHHGGKGLSSIMMKETAGLPNWAWLLVVGAGLAAAYLLPKFFGGSSSNTPASSTPTSSVGDTSGIGLAVDPTTGLPYAVEGLVPSGANAGAGTPSPTPTPTPVPPPTPTPPPTPQCKPGFNFVAQGPVGMGTLRRGSYPVQGGYCVPTSSSGSGSDTDHDGDDTKGGKKTPVPVPKTPAPVSTNPAWPGGTRQVRMPPVVKKVVPAHG